MVTKPSTPVLDAATGVARPVDLQRAMPSLLGPEGHESRTLSGTGSAILKFCLHFIEMAIAMGVGMAIFGPVKSALNRT